MIDVIIIFAFIIYSISNGFRNQSKASENLEEYFLAGRSIRGWRAGFSLAATQFAADTPLLVTGLIATGGIFMLWRLWERINLFSEISAIIVSLIFAPIILFTVDAEWLRLLLMSSISTAVVITVTLLTRPTDEKILVEFYKKVDPPGFWKNTAGKLKQETRYPVKAFKQAAYLTVTTSLSLYLLLVGFGKLILPNPASPIAYSWIYIIAGVASIALWWKKLFKKSEPSDRMIS